MALAEINEGSLHEPNTPYEEDILRRMNVARVMTCLLGLELNVINIAQVADQLDKVGYPRDADELTLAIDAVTENLEAKKRQTIATEP